MLGGQSVDVMNEKAGHFAIDREMLDYIYENKTSALLEAAMMAGAALAGANDDDLDALCRIASKSESRSRSGTTSWMSHPRWRSLESRFSVMKRMKNNVCDDVWHRRGGAGGKTAHERGRRRTEKSVLSGR